LTRPLSCEAYARLKPVGLNKKGRGRMNIKAIRLLSLLVVVTIDTRFAMATGQ
jgi:hypothetical protein